MVETANTIWADGPGGSPTQPSKALIRAWGTNLERALNQSAGSVIFASLSALNAALDYDAHQRAEVRGDGSNDGVYAKSGASGSGSWTYVAPLPEAIATTGDNRFFGGAGNTTLSGINNTGLGVGAADALTTGSYNVAYGGGALGAVATGNYNTAVGAYALSLYTGSEATAFGYGALSLLTTGTRNAAFGLSAGGGITTGQSNLFVGYGAGSAGIGQLATADFSVGLGTNAYTTASYQLAFPDAIDEVRMFGAVMFRGYLSKKAYFFGEIAGNRNITSGGAMVGIGAAALANVTAAGNVTAVGDYAMNSHTTGNNSTAYGAKAMRSSTTLTDCTAVGSLALENAVTGVGDVAVGFRALQYATVARNNVGIGDSALWLSQGGGNVAIGYRVAEYATSGDDNIFVGRAAGVNRADGSQNIYIGNNSGDFPGVTPNPLDGTGAQSAGDGNVALGHNTLRNATDDDNTAIGHSAGTSITTGSTNTFLGHDAGNNGSQKVDAVNSMALGNGAFTTASNQVVLGNSSVTETVLRGAISYGAGPSVLTSPAAAVHQLGAADAASPVAQSLRAQSVATGTSNTAGASLYIQGSRGTGTGQGGSIIFQVAPEGSSGSTQNAYATAMTILRTKDVSFEAGVYVGTSSVLFFSGRAGIRSTADGVIQLRNNDGSLDASLSLASGIMHVNKALAFSPGTSVTPASNGDVTIEFTNNTTLTFKGKGSDGTVRTATLTLA